MAKHKFISAFVPNKDEDFLRVQCAHCGKLVVVPKGKIPDDALKEECRREDFSQAAARIVREATGK